MATYGGFQEDSLHPPANRDGEGVVRKQAVRREQLEALFLRLDQQQFVGRVTVTERNVECPHRVPQGHRYEYHLLILQHGEDGIRLERDPVRPGLVVRSWTAKRPIAPSHRYTLIVLQ